MKVRPNSNCDRRNQPIVRLRCTVGGWLRLNPEPSKLGLVRITDRGEGELLGSGVASGLAVEGLTPLYQQHSGLCSPLYGAKNGTPKPKREGEAGK